MNIQWSNTYNTKKQSFNYDCLLPMIDHKNWIPDELHLMLRIRDILLECLFSDLCRNLKKFENEMANRIIEETRRIGITKFEFYDLKSSKCNWTTLNGSDKLKFLEFFLVSKFYNNEKGINIEKMWREFVCLYKLIRKTALSDIEIDNFQKDVKQWIKTFTNIYRSEDVTPYMHVFAMHIPQFLKELKNQALSLRLFSSSVCLFFGITCMGGGEKKQSAVYKILNFENRQLYYLKNNTPSSFKKKNYSY
ncbi:19613_t:CDS:2 [Entrophospora sp. SA101]|nr:19613_t:CDS:2 [Entrophospora sp. SA101]